MAEVYWIHLPEHTDLFSQGYIGVTSKTAAFRFNQHKQDARRKEYATWHFTKALKKYGDRLVCDTVLVGEEEYCYGVEFKLRPENNIGWNTAAGGQRPVRNPGSYGDEWKTKLRDANLGKKHSEETLLKIAEISKNHWGDESYKEKHRLISCNVSVSIPLSEITVGFWRYGKSQSIISRKADEVFEIFTKNPKLFAREIVRELGVDETGANIQAVRKILRKFRGGWSPLEDGLWVSDFKGENNGS